MNIEQLAQAKGHQFIRHANMWATYSETLNGGKITRVYAFPAVFIEALTVAEIGAWCLRSNTVITTSDKLVANLAVWGIAKIDRCDVGDIAALISAQLLDRVQGRFNDTTKRGNSFKPDH